MVNTKHNKPTAIDAWIVFLLMAAVLAIMGLCKSPAHGQSILQFSASWCGPCQSMRPVVDSLERQGVRIEHVDIDREPGRKQQYGVSSIPAFIAVDANGRQVGPSLVGVQSEAALRQLWATVAIARPAQQQPGQAGSQPQAVQVDPHEPCQPWQDARVVKIRNYDGTGQDGCKRYGFLTGSIISVDGDSGYVLSCAHGNQGAGDPVLLIFNDGRTTCIGDTVDVDREADCSIIKIRGKAPAKSFSLAAVDPSPGHKLYLAGFANSTHWRGRWSSCRECSECIVAEGPAISGESGGPVLNEQGQIVGVIDACDVGEGEQCDGRHGTVTFCCRLRDIRGLLDRCCPNRRGLIVPRATPQTPQQPLPSPPQPVTPGITPQPEPSCDSNSCCDPSRLASIEAAIESLKSGKQDRGDYLTADSLSGYAKSCDVPTIPQPPDLSCFATKGDLNETNGLFDKLVNGMGEAIDSRVSKSAASVAATSILGVPSWLALPTAVIGGPLGVGLSLAALIAYRRLKKRSASRGTQSDGFCTYGDSPVAGKIGPRDAGGNPVSYPSGY